MMWFTCIACDIYINPRMYRKDRQDFILTTRRCSSCFSNNTLRQVKDAYNRDYFPDAFTYAFLNRCRMCGEFTAVSSGTGSCIKCDKDPFDTPINHGDFYDEDEKYVKRIR